MGIRALLRYTRRTPPQTLWAGVVTRSYKQERRPR